MVFNIMNQARVDKSKYFLEHGGDAGVLLKRFNEKKLEDDDWEFASHVQFGTLERLWWMSPYQKLLCKFSGEVLIIDACEGRNLYDYYLITFIVIDGENKNRSAAFCIHKTQDGETFEWMFQQMDRVFRRYSMPEAIFFDQDAGIELGVSKVWPIKFHCYCLWHIVQNIRKALGGKLRHGYNAFMQDFWAVYRVGSPDLFDQEWNRLVSKWSVVQIYLNNLYRKRSRWAWAWTGPIFVAGMRTTGRVEVEHKIYKGMGLNRRYDLLMWYLIDIGQHSTNYSISCTPEAHSNTLKITVRSIVFHPIFVLFH